MGADERARGVGALTPRLRHKTLTKAIIPRGIVFDRIKSQTARRARSQTKRRDGRGVMLVELCAGGGRGVVGPTARRPTSLYPRQVRRKRVFDNF